MFERIWRPLSAILVVVLSVASVSAQSLDQLDTALKRLPADTAFFSAMLRNQEQIDAAKQSRAWQKLWSLPVVQMGWANFQKELNKSEARAFLDDPENKELLALLSDGVSREVFISGGGNWSESIKFFQEVYGTMYWNNKLGSAGLGPKDPSVQLQALIQELIRQQQHIKIPDLIIGFKLTDLKRAENQLARLEALVTPQIEQNPKLKGRLTSEKINGGRFLVLKLDGSMVPWDEFPWEKIDVEQDEIDALIEKLKSTTLTVSLGVQQGYAMLGIGSGTKHLADFGGTGPKLHSVAEFQPLAKFADRKLVSIEYASKKLISAVNQNVNMEELVAELKKELPKAPLSDEQRERLEKDADQFAKEWKSEPVVGAKMGFNFWTDRGLEGYQYDYSKKPGRDGSKPLTMLNHLGDKPIFAAVGRSKIDGKSYAFFSKWIKVVWGHVDEFTQSQFEDDAKAKYSQVTEIAIPALKRFDEITSQSLLPALADGQAGFVLDAKWKNRQWIAHLPPLPQPMPMIELAILLGVSDDVKLAGAIGSYRKVINDTIATVGKLKGYEAVTLARIPPPETLDIYNGMLYYYPLPGLVGLDERVTPTAGLSKTLAVLTLSHDHAQRLLKTTKPTFDSKPLAKVDRPLAGATVFDFPQLVQSASPWIELAAGQIISESLGKGGQQVPDDQRAAIMSQVRTVLEVLQVFRGGTSATYVESDALVTHSETVIKDLE